MTLFVRWLLALCLVVVVACSKKAPPVVTDAPLPVVTEASTDLLFTWIDDKGDFHVEQKVADVPNEAREAVRVADPVKDPAKLDDVFVADLRSPGEGGAYPVRTMSRAEFEKMAVERRQRSGRVLAPRGAESAPPPAAAVIIYGASWCGPCHQAARYLRQRGVAFVEKDIEQDSGANREMQGKLAGAGMRGGSIPVLDVRGKILIGFDPGAVDRALSHPL